VQIFTEFCATSHISEATTAKRMKIDPYYLRPGPCLTLEQIDDAVCHLVLCCLYTLSVFKSH